MLTTTGDTEAQRKSRGRRATSGSHGDDGGRMAMGSFRKSPPPDADKPIILTPKVAFMCALPNRRTVVWSGDPAEWERCAGELQGARVIDRAPDPEWVEQVHAGSSPGWR